MNPSDHSHEGGLSVRDQIERYRTAFIAVVTMFVIAVAVGGYILAHENLHLPSWVPVLGHDYYDLKAEFETAQAVTPGQGQAVTIAGAKVGEVASVELHNGIAVVSMKVTPKYARFYKNATLLLRPKTQLQDITIEVNPGDAVRRQAEQRRNGPARADGAERQLRRIPGRPRRRNARLPAAAAGGSRQRLRKQRHGVRGDAQALRARRPPRARNPEGTRQALGQHQPLDPQLQAADGSTRQQGQAGRRARRRLQRRLPDVREGGDQLRSHPETASRRAPQDGQSARQGRRSLRSGHSGSDQAQPVRQSAGAGAGSGQEARDQDGPDHRERNPPVRARNPADRERTRAEHPGARRIVPAPRRGLLGAQRILQRARLQPGQGQGRLRLLPRLGQPQPQQRREQQRRARDRRAQPDLLQLQNPADPQRRRRSQRKRLAADRAAAAADQTGMRSARPGQKSRRHRTHAPARGPARRSARDRSAT